MRKVSLAMTPLALAALVVLTGCRANNPNNPAKDNPGKGGPPNAGPQAPDFSGISEVKALAVSRDGNLVAATWGNPPGVGIWELAGGKPKCGTIGGYFEVVAFTSDSKALVGMGTTEDKFAVWDTAGKELRTAKLPSWKEGGGATMATFLTLTPDDKYGYAIHNASKVARLHVADAKLDLLESKITEATPIAYSAALDLFAGARPFPDRLWIIKPDDKDAPKEVPLPFRARGLAFSSDGKTLAVALDAKDKDKSLFDRVELLDTKDWKARATLPKTDKGGGLAFGCYGKMAISPDGKYLAGGNDFFSEKKGVELWDIAAQTVRTVDEGSLASAIVFTPDSKNLLIGHEGGGVKSVDTGGAKK
jgi:WD40 repeat protein